MIQSPVPQGWQCPVCKNVYSPLIPVCTKCSRDQAWKPIPNQPLFYPDNPIVMPTITCQEEPRP